MLADQLSYDNDLLFNTADLARSVTVAGSTVTALVRGAREKETGHIDGVTEELVITVRKADVSTAAKGTAVVVDGETWEIYRQLVIGYLNYDLLLRRDVRPVLRRPL